ncbi:MAG: hypothetical protein ABI778_02265 [Ignavibacteriota bacterium]
MNIRDEEQLQQYFERQMTGSQEQNFLINVAARDDMRLAFRSQLELLKAVREDKDASGSPTFIRTKTLTALGLGGALVPSGLKEQEIEASMLPSPTIMQNILSGLKRPAVSMAAGLLAGVLGTAMLMPSNTATEKVAAPATIISAPQIEAPHEAAPSTIAAEPLKIQAKKIVSNHAPTTAVPPQSVTQKESLPVIITKNPGGIENKNTIHKPEQAGQK